MFRIVALISALAASALVFAGATPAVSETATTADATNAQLRHEVASLERKLDARPRLTIRHGQIFASNGNIFVDSKGSAVYVGRNSVTFVGDVSFR